MGNGHWALGIEEAAISDVPSNTILPMPHCPMPYLIFCFFSAFGSRFATAANSASINVRPVAAR
jgi:hypothetical protein